MVARFYSHLAVFKCFCELLHVSSKNEGKLRVFLDPSGSHLYYSKLLRFQKVRRTSLSVPRLEKSLHISNSTSYFYIQLSYPQRSYKGYKLA